MFPRHFARLVGGVFVTIGLLLAGLAHAETINTPITIRQTIEITIPADKMDTSTLINLLTNLYGTPSIIEEAQNIIITLPATTLPVDAPSLRGATGEVVEPAPAESVLGSDAAAPADSPVEEALSVSTETAPETELSLIVLPGSLRLNEVLPNPEDGQKEWVEIYNPFNNLILTRGMYMKDASGKKMPIEDAVVGFDQYLLVEVTGSILNNSGDSVTLYAADGSVVDSMTYRGTFERGETAGWSVDGWKKTQAATARLPNIFPSPSPPPEPTPTKEVETPTETPAIVTQAATTLPAAAVPANLRLVELYPSPYGPDETEEYVTIVNGGERPGDIMGWALSDASGKMWKAAGTRSIAPREEVRLPRTMTGIALNNDTDTVTLLHPNGLPVDSVTYEKAQKGARFRKSVDAWTWHNDENPTKESSGTSELEIPEVTLTRAPPKEPPKATGKKTSPAPSRAERIEGTVSATPGMFSSQTFYLSGPDTQVYMQKADFPPLAIGSQITVQGTWGEAYGEKRFRVQRAADITITGEGPPPEATPIGISSIGEQNVGTLMETGGEVVEAASDRIRLKEGGAELLVVAKDGTDVRFDDISPGDRLMVIGILTSRNGTRQLLPRGVDDLAVEKSAAQTAAATTTPIKESPRWLYSAGALAGSTSLLLVWFIRSRQLKHLAFQTSYGN